MGRRSGLLLLGLVLMISMAWGQDRPTSVVIAPPFAKLWIDHTATTTSGALRATLSEIAEQEENPDHLIVMLHGYDMGPEESARLYESLAHSLKTGLYPDRVAVVGVQWEAGGSSLLNPAGDYLGTLSRSRDVGRGPVRQLLLALQDRYPEAPVSVMAHSMGCEIALAAVAPEITYLNNAPKSPAFEAQREVTLLMAAFVGSDLDYDAWYQAGQAGQKWFERCRLTWSTVTDPSSQGDRVLSLRARLRGKAAGSLFPRMTEDQLDYVIAARRFYLDGHDVPSNHAFDAYFSAARLRRILATLRFLSQPEVVEPAELAALRQAMEAPDDLGALLPYLDSPYAGAAFCALWRVERINCGDARHLSDQTLERAVLMLANSPQAIWREQANSACHTLRKGQFPTEATMTRAGAPPRSRPQHYRPER